MAWCVAFGVVATTPSIARADSVADAKDLFSQARDLRAHGDCAHAVTLFRKAYELYPAGLGSLRNFAECEESLGQFSSARRAWLDLKQAVLTTTDKKYEGWNHDAEQAVDRLQPKLASLTVDVKVTGNHGEVDLPAEGFEVTVNGEALAAPLFGTALEHDPGTYVVRVAGPRLVEPIERTVQLGTSDAQHVALDLVVATEPPPPPIEAQAQAPLPVSPPDTPPPPREDHSKAQKILGWSAVGVGAAGFIGAGISLAVRQSALSSVSTICDSTDTCARSKQGDVASAMSRGQTASTLFTVLGIVGVVGVAGGVVLLETAPSHGAQAALVLSPGAVTLGGQF